MIPVYQTIFGFGKGNCFAACIASILELSINEVPNFCWKEDNWRDFTNRWLSSFDMFYIDLRLPEDMRKEIVSYWGYHIISGDGPRGVRHSVVGHQGKMVFDPHPDGTGLIEKDLEYGMIIRKM